MSPRAIRAVALGLCSAYAASACWVIAAGGPLLGSFDRRLAHGAYHALPPLLFLPVFWSAAIFGPILALAAWHLVAGRPRRGASMAAALLATWGIYAATKLATAQPRPYVALGVPAARAGTDYQSFPSGHAALAALLLALAATGRGTAIALALVLAYVMASRMVLGMHHLGDVVAGALLGLGVGLAFRQAPERRP